MINMILIFIICIIIVFFCISNKPKGFLYKKYTLGSIHNISKHEFIKMMDLYPFEYHKSKTGVVGNLYGRHISTNKAGDVWYKYPQTIPENIRYPPYHTSGSSKGNAIALLNNRDFYYYIRYSAGGLLFTKYLNNFLPHTPGITPSMCLVSRKGTITNLHNDNGERWQYLLFGKKKWIIINKKYRKEMGFFEDKSKPSRSITFTKKINEKNIPVPYQTVIAESGSMIYFPPDWLHYVETLEDMSVSINFRRK